jgi:hypothetical protein
LLFSPTNVATQSIRPRKHFDTRDLKEAKALLAELAA